MTGAFEVSFPAMMLVQLSDGSEELFTGNLAGYANGNAKYNLQGPTTGSCTGGYVKKTGINTITCENGFSYSENIGRRKAKMSGVNIAAGTDFVGAFGWGNDANEESVRQAIAEYKLSQT